MRNKNKRILLKFFQQIFLYLPHILQYLWERHRFLFRKRWRKAESRPALIPAALAPATRIAHPAAAAARPTSPRRSRAAIRRRSPPAWRAHAMTRKTG